MPLIKLPFSREHTGDASGDRMQRLAQQASKQLSALPFSSGAWLKNVAVTTSGTNIAHGLGRAWQGWILTRVRSSAMVYESATQPTDATKQIGLTSSSNVTVDLFVF